MSRLSVNINKVATIRNARGGNNPNLLQVALDCERFGADGITVHPRPDERHIRFEDVYTLKKHLTTELNIEGYPNKKFIELIKEIVPAQVTLVPDPPGVLTSNAGWNLKKEATFISGLINEFKTLGIRTSIFMDCDLDQLSLVPETGTDRVELYTGPYAEGYILNREEAIEPYNNAGMLLKKQGIELNAGHDLDLKNLAFFSKNMPHLKEVSIGHALISDSLYYGLENTIQMYQRELKGWKA